MNTKHENQMKTRNGARCIPTGRNKEVGSMTYRECQMLPIHPQRFEWINERNLSPDR